MASTADTVTLLQHDQLNVSEYYFVTLTWSGDSVGTGIDSVGTDDSVDIDDSVAIGDSVAVGVARILNREWIFLRTSVLNGGGFLYVYSDKITGVFLGIVIFVYVGSKIINRFIEFIISHDIALEEAIDNFRSNNSLEISKALSDVYRLVNSYNLIENQQKISIANKSFFMEKIMNLIDVVGL